MTIYSCTTSSRYSMSAQLLLESIDQDEDTGEIVRGYELSQPFSCYASGIAASGKDAPGTFENFSGIGLYSSTDYVRMYTIGSIPRSSKVTWITDSAGQAWAEDNGMPTIFDANGSVPIVNAAGRIVEYVTMLSRSEVQDATLI